MTRITILGRHKGEEGWHLSVLAEGKLVTTEVAPTFFATISRLLMTATTDEDRDKASEFALTLSLNSANEMTMVEELSKRAAEIERTEQEAQLLEREKAARERLARAKAALEAQ